MDLLVSLDRGSTRPLCEQLFDEIRTAIVAGRHGPGTRLPATRSLAGQLGISRFTVEDAYTRLIAEGYVVGRRGSGTYVSPAAVLPAAVGRDSPGSDRDAAPAPRPWSAWAARVGVTEGARPPMANSILYPFRHGVPALDAFPRAVWQRQIARAARSLSPTTHDYGPSAGYPPLRSAIAAYLARSRAIVAGADRVVVTAGAQQALDLLARLLLEPGDTVVVEDPGYPAARRIFAAAGATIVGVPVDHDGLRVDRLGALADRAKLVYVTPSHQYPTGATLSLARRVALLEWARERGALVIEDDYDGEFRYGERPLAALAGLDIARVGSVVYVGTFSKVLSPSLRLGYAVLPADMVDHFAAAKEIADHHSPTAEQMALASFIAEGHFERHLARMRRLYAARRAALIDGLSIDLANVARRDSVGGAAGLHLLVAFDVDWPENTLLARAAARGVGLDPGGSCYVESVPSRPSALIGYAALPEDKIRAGIRALAVAIRGR